MALKLKPKLFGPVFALYDGTDTIQHAIGDPAAVTPHPPAGSPVDTLLASLAACILKSIQWSADQHKAALIPFTVRVDGTKSLDLPGRVEKMHITIIGLPVTDETLVEAIVKQAKSICTVSNTLNCEITIETLPNA